MLVVGNSLEKAFKSMKKFFLPYSFKNWFLFGLIALFSGRMGNNFGNNYGYNMGSSEIQAFDIAKYLGWIIFGVISVVIFGLLFTFVGAVITFILIENCDRKKMKLDFKFRENLKKGWEYFLFIILMFIVGVLIVIGLSWPFINVFVNNGWSFVGLSMTSFPWSTLWWIIPLFLLWLLFVSVISLIVAQFAIFDMHRRKVSLIEGIKNSWRLFKKHIGEFVLYYLLLIGIPMGLAIIIMMISFIIVFPLMLLLGVIFLAFPAIVGIVIAIIGILFFIVGITFIVGPITYLLTKFSLNFYDAIIKKK